MRLRDEVVRYVSVRLVRECVRYFVSCSLFAQVMLHEFLSLPPLNGTMFILNS